MTVRSSSSVAACARCASVQDSGNGSAVESAVPPASIASCAMTVSRKWVPVARPVMSPWSIHVRSESDFVNVPGTAAAAMTSPTC